MLLRRICLFLFYFWHTFKVDLCLNAVVISSRESSLRRHRLVRNVELWNHFWDVLRIVDHGLATYTQHIHPYSQSRGTKSWRMKKSAAVRLYTAADSLSPSSEGEYPTLESKSELASILQSTSSTTKPLGIVLSIKSPPLETAFCTILTAMACLIQQ